MEIEYKQLTAKDVPSLREEISRLQNYTCPLCGKPLGERVTLDHQHKYRKSDPNIEEGNGLIRGVLCADCNILEGKIFNAATRFLNQPSKKERIEWLERLVAYYKKDPYPFIHPSEKPLDKKLSKRNFNKLNKLYNSKYNKSLDFPKSGKMTKKLIKIYEEFSISPYN